MKWEMGNYAQMQVIHKILYITYLELWSHKKNFKAYKKLDKNQLGKTTKSLYQHCLKLGKEEVKLTTKKPDNKCSQTTTEVETPRLYIHLIQV